jgi:MYXO-CTERM domain-containing protein
MKPTTLKIAAISVFTASLLATSASAQLSFTAGTTVASGGQPFVNNLIDIELANLTNNATTTLTAYTTTSGQNITGSITRSNLATGSLITSTQFNSLISAAQTANQLSGVVNFSGGSGTVTGNAFTGSNSTGLMTFTSSIAISNTNFVSRTFTAANSVGTGSTNSAPVNGGGYFNSADSTITFSTPVNAFGFTQLQRDGGRTYSWSMRIVEIANPLNTQSISLGSITMAGATAGMTSGDANANNYRYDVFVGYQAPEGFLIDQLIRGGANFSNMDSFAYATAIPEPSAFAAVAGLGVLGLAASRRRRRNLV